jgi:TonB family protein
MPEDIFYCYPTTTISSCLISRTSLLITYHRILMRHFILFLLIWGSFQSHAQQIVPEYPGGTAVLFKYLSDSLLLPSVLYKKGLKGETVVSFVVDTGGYVTDVHITRSLHPALDTAVIRLVSSMSRWSPGMADGHPVKVRYTLPIK